MSERDPELTRLLIAECEKHARALVAADRESLRRILHSVKGTAGVAGETALSDAFARLERRGDDPSVRAEATSLLSAAVENMRAGGAALQDSWPVPPPGLTSSRLAPELLGPYESQTRERIESLDAVLTDVSDSAAALEEAFRIVHAMKGAAGAVNDEPLAWFCHGLESRLRIGLQDRERVTPLLEELSVWRSVISELASEPDRALDALRGKHASQATADGSPPVSKPGQTPDDAWLHVPSAALDRVLERLRVVGTVTRDASHQADVARATARTLRSARARLMEARRLIGPPRPWGVPAAALARIQEAETQVSHAAASVERVASVSSEHARAAHQGAMASQLDLEGLRKATMAVVFDKVRASIEASVGRRGDLLNVQITGAGTLVDRRLADRLIDPVLQLARNAVAHGIEPPDVRTEAGKPACGSITLAAETRGAHLIVTVEDDGAGVDVDALRASALRAGLITPETARDADDEALVHLVFLPGLTTRRAADLLAGRGVGLDLALRAVRRLGGTIRMHNRPHRGLRAVVEVPLVERGLVRVLWVSTGPHRVALPARQVLRVRPSSELDIVPRSLSHWLDPHAEAATEEMVLDLGSGVTGAPSILSCTVHSVDAIEETSARPVPPLVSTAGPYVGVILADDGTPALLVDALVLAERRRETASKT